MIYVVRWGTTLSAVSRQYGVPVETLARVNQIPDPDVLVEGQALLIPEERSEGILSVEVGGYAYPFISPWVLRETLERINGLAVFSYGFTPTGELLPPALNDRWMVQRAAEKGVRPVLVMTPLDRSGVFSNYKYQLTVPAHSVKQVTLDYLLVACSYGSVIHSVEMK